jgi:hypothetical protein
MPAQILPQREQVTTVIPVPAGALFQRKGVALQPLKTSAHLLEMLEHLRLRLKTSAHLLEMLEHPRLRPKILAHLLEMTDILEQIPAGTVQIVEWTTVTIWIKTQRGVMLWKSL